MQLSRVLCSGLLLAGLSTAWASPTEDLAAAKAALAAGDTAKASKALDRAEDEMESTTDLLPTSAIGQYFYYRGMVVFLEKGTGDDTLDAWRQALVVDLDRKWDAEISDDTTARDLFLALRNEVKDRGVVSAQVPEATGAARLWVDGQRVRAGDEVREGEHFAQITCDDGLNYGTFVDFSKKLKWLKLCPNGVDTSVVVEEVAIDDLDEFGPSFGGDGGDTGSEAATSGSTGTVPVGNSGDPEIEIIPAWSRVKWPFVIGGGVALAAAGGLQLAANGQNKSFYDLDNSSIRSRSDAEALRGRTNTLQSAALGTLVLSGGLLTVAVIPF